MIQRLAPQRRRIQSTILMDIFFGLVIVANGAMMGLTTQGVVDESSDEAQIFELVPWSAWSATNFAEKVPFCLMLFSMLSMSFSEPEVTMEGWNNSKMGWLIPTQ